MFLVQVGRYQRWNFPSEDAFYQCVRDRGDGIFLGPKHYDAVLVADKHPMIVEDNKYAEEHWKKVRATRRREEMMMSFGTAS